MILISKHHSPQRLIRELLHFALSHYASEKFLHFALNTLLHFATIITFCARVMAPGSFCDVTGLFEKKNTDD